MNVNYEAKVPVIDINDKYCLREHTTDDTDAFFEYYGNPNVGRYIMADTPKTREDADQEMHYCRNLFRFKRGLYWSLAQKSDDKMVGAIGLHINNYNRRAELHYDLAEALWGKGLVAKALLGIIPYCFDTMKLNRLEAVTLPDNMASQRVLEKCGFVREGVLHNYKFYDGQSLDVIMFSLTPNTQKSE